MKENLFPEARNALRLVMTTSANCGVNRTIVEDRVMTDCLQALINAGYVYKAYADSGKLCYHDNFNAYRATLKGRNYFQMDREEKADKAIDRFLQVLCGMGGGFVVWLLTFLLQR